ncbi:Dehydrogenase/reductase SDR family member 12 [Rhypophila sp. PSN 637]
MSPISDLPATLTQIYPPTPTFTEADYGLELTKIPNAAGGNAQGRSHYKDIAVKSPPTTTSTQLKFLHLDLNDLNIVRAAVTTFAQQESRLDVLWNNAGTGANAGKPGQRTAQDLELMIGFHCVSTLLFTQLLVPELCAAAATCPPGQTRVVWTSSRLAEAGSPPNNIDMGPDAKLRGVQGGHFVLGREFARRYKNDGIVSTASFDGTPASVMCVMNRVMLSEPVFGADTELFAGLSPKIIPWGRVRANVATGRQDLMNAGDSETERGLLWRLWKWCEEKWA